VGGLKMISVRKNPNFKEWFQVFAFGKMIDEVRRESEAMRLARQVGRRASQDYVYFVDRAVKIEKKL
jgi:hypothetical protein|tara:strand:+ start:547 stop:747 length:201 start_codon:yes stop_codon:yes gene_type:complete